MTEPSDIDEFMELVGSKRLPEYHFYYLDTGELWGIRLDSREPKADHLPWPIVWRRNKSSRRLGLAIGEYILKGKATAKEHTDESRWRD